MHSSNQPLEDSIEKVFWTLLRRILDGETENVGKFGCYLIQANILVFNLCQAEPKYMLVKKVSVPNFDPF